MWAPYSRTRPAPKPRFLKRKPRVCATCVRVWVVCAKEWTGSERRQGEKQTHEAKRRILRRGSTAAGGSSSGFWAKAKTKRRLLLRIVRRGSTKTRAQIALPRVKGGKQTQEPHISSFVHLTRARAIVADANLQAVHDSTVNHLSHCNSARERKSRMLWESRDGRPKSNPICASSPNSTRLR